MSQLLLPLKGYFTQLGLASEKCFEQLFVKFNFAETECAKTFLSKGLGLGIVGGSSLVKLPQVFKILGSGSGAGISLLGVLLELLACTANGAYSFDHQYPFSTYGEAVFLSLQNSLIAFLVLLFAGKTIFALLFTVVYGGLIFALMQPGLVPEEILWYGQAANIPMVVVGKLIQVWTNFSNGHTGQLSAITVFLLAAGSLARIFTSIQETGDPIVILTYVCSSAVNVILAFQVLWYWKVSATGSKTEKGSKKNAAAAQEAARKRNKPKKA